MEKGKPGVICELKLTLLLYFTAASFDLSKPVADYLGTYLTFLDSVTPPHSK